MGIRINVDGITIFSETDAMHWIGRPHVSEIVVEEMGLLICTASKGNECVLAELDAEVSWKFMDDLMRYGWPVFAQDRIYENKAIENDGWPS